MQQRPTKGASDAGLLAEQQSWWDPGLCRQAKQNFYDGLKEVYGPKTSGAFPLLRADGSTLITDKEKILERWPNTLIAYWTTHPPSTMKPLISYFRLQLMRRWTPYLLWKRLRKLYVCYPVAKQLVQMPSQLKSTKKVAWLWWRKLHQLFQLIWQHETVPQDFKDASIVHLYKRKGNRQICDNHCGIPLLSIAGKILARALLNCLIAHLEQSLLPESQCGFRKEHRTIDMVCVSGQLQEKCHEQNADLYSTYVDLTKAFDTVSRERLWRIMAKYGYPRKFIAILHQFHDEMLTRVQHNGETSEPFLVSNGVTQGCVLAPTLFSLMFSAMMTDAFRETDIGIGIRYTNRWINLQP